MPANQTPQNNVVLLVADDLGKQLSCYQTLISADNAKTSTSSSRRPLPSPATPNIDSLAASGTLFSRAFASTASCSGSRSTIYTGLHTHQSGQYGLSNRRHHFTTFDHIETLPSILNAQQSDDTAYLTGIVGKVHVGPASVYPWHVRNESGTRDVSWVSSRCGSFFRQAKSQNRPFCLTVGFIDPHRDLTRSGFGNYDDFASIVGKAKYTEDDVVVPDFLNDTPGTRKELAEYYNSISRLDQGVGMVLAELETSGLGKDTMVIFLSDNGPPFINSKTTLYDAGVCLPLIVRDPRSGRNGVVNPNMISYIDILPTILDFTEHPSPTHPARVGRSFLPVISATENLPDWSQVYGSHTFHEVTNYWPTRFLRDRQYKYHRNIAWRLDFPFAADIYGSLSWEDVRNASPSSIGSDSSSKADTESGKVVGHRKLKDYFFRPPEELYDLLSDPHEVHNLASDPERRKVLDSMRDLLEVWQRRTEDPWLYRDGVSVLLVKHHLDAGLKMPDRWDLNADDPSSNGKPIFNSALPWGADVDALSLPLRQQQQNGEVSSL